MKTENYMPTQKEIVAVLAQIQQDSITRNLGSTQRDPAELLQGIRCGIAIHALEVMTDSEVMEWVQSNRKTKWN